MRHNLLFLVCLVLAGGVTIGPATIAADQDVTIGDLEEIADRINFERLTNCGATYRSVALLTAFYKQLLEKCSLDDSCSMDDNTLESRKDFTELQTRWAVAVYEAINFVAERWPDTDPELHTSTWYQMQMSIVDENTRQMKSDFRGTFDRLNEEASSCMRYIESLETETPIVFRAVTEGIEYMCSAEKYDCEAHWKTVFSSKPD